MPWFVHGDILDRYGQIIGIWTRRLASLRRESLFLIRARSSACLGYTLSVKLYEYFQRVDKTA